MTNDQMTNRGRGFCIGHWSLVIRHSRRGLSLLEMLAVVTLLAIVAAVVIGRNGRTLVANFASQGDARRVALALLQAKRRAITTGTDHAVEFTSGGGDIASLTVVSIDGGGATTIVDGPLALEDDLAVTASHTQMVFNFEGQAAAAYWIQLAGANRTWRIDVVPITGTIHTREVP
jgi:prepilin-type N-terminal cleavage/methylation domain-containing protein